MSDDTKDRDDPAHQTMPPELRPFAKPEPPQRLVAPENEAEFKAALGALQLLNGGPGADPFYVEPKKDAAPADRKAPASVRAYSPPAVVPSAEASVRKAVSGKVVIAEAVPEDAAARTNLCEEVDVRPFREAREAREAAEAAKAAEAAALRVAKEAPKEKHEEPVPAEGEKEKPQDAAPSPWTKETPIEAVRGSALPSSHRPRELRAPEGRETVVTRPANGKAAGVPLPARRATTAMVIAVVVVGLAFMVRALMTGDPPVNGASGGVPTVTGTVTSVVPPVLGGTVPAPAPTIVPSTGPVVAPPAASSGAEVVPAPSSRGRALDPRRGAPAPAGTGYDPYVDAAVKPLPVVPAPPPPPPPLTAPPPPPPPPATQEPAPQGLPYQKKNH